VGSLAQQVSVPGQKDLDDLELETGFHAGMIEKVLGQNAAATASLKQALASNPHFSPYQEPVLRQALTELGGTP
jgi:hypothetical protein